MKKCYDLKNVKIQKRKQKLMRQNRLNIETIQMQILLPFNIYKQKILGMNIFNQSFSTLGSSVFIEVNNSERIRTMKQLLEKGQSSEIQKYFFSTNESRDLNIAKLTESQINRHQYVLSHRNKMLLKSILKSSHQGQLDTIDLKMLHEEGSLSPASNEDVHQYLTFNQVIDFDAFSRKR